MSTAGPHTLALELRDVALHYGARRGLFGDRFFALRDASLSVRRGETLGVIGRNAAGKSTLLRVMAGILDPDQGQLRNHGVSVSLLALGVGFEPTLTGRQNAVLSGMLCGMRRRAIARRIDAICDFAELRDSIDRPVGTYSSGMHARLGFAVAMETNPDVLLIDETIGVGDVSFREKSSDVIRARARSDKTIVLVSHSGRLIEELCDRAAWIEAGTIRSEGAVTEIKREYYDFMKRRDAGDRSS